ncbi:hypothetical protein MNBD_GAMMA17-2108 [hydrothermal vent metagenome]|uniref:Histidine kinase n=1 Tax=hydrothermal vent metagenome TaxID=652676 RepID=A0A3B0ZDT0_9ZZZZ
MFRDLIEALPDALVVTDSDGQIAHINALAEAMFGYCCDEIIGQQVEQLMPERFRGAHGAHHASYFEAPRIRPLNECMGLYGQHKEGHEFAIEIYLSPLRERGNVWGLAAIRDISARKKMEDELRCARDELELRVEARTVELARINESLRREMDERNRMAEQARQLNAELAHVSRLSILGEMTSGMAHELNQPLAAISNYAQGCVRRMRNENEDVDLQSIIPALERVTAEASRAAEIIARFRQFARKEALQKQRVTMAELVHRAVDLERFEAEACGLQLHVELQAELPDVLVDEIQIQQVMVNLVRNAIEVTKIAATVPPSIFVKVYRTNDGENGNVVVAVEDSGHGFSEQLGQQMFQPFFTTKPEGLGMGLSISRSIIEAHGGRLWADSSQKSGATFFFSLPASEEV